MQFTIDMGKGTNQIRGYQVGEIKVNDNLYYQNIIVTPTEIIPNWEPQSIKALNAQHLAMLATHMPQVILIGTGENPAILDNDLLQPLLQQGIGVEVMTTAAACRTYNVLMAEGRKVLAALFLV